MEDRVEQFIEKHHLIPYGETLVVGVSGGPDSMALFHFLKDRQEKYGIRLVCCSIDHGLRGAESKEDVQFVQDISASWKIPFEGVSVDVPEYMKAEKLGTQEAARDKRFNVFKDTLLKWGSRFLVLAQHGDDQIETMLMQHVRGGSGASLAGMPVKRVWNEGVILRPFLCITKEDILGYCQRHGIPYRKDPSNDSDNYTRNRFRHHVLPFLKKENPQVHARFQQQSEWLFDENAFLDQLAQEKLKGICTSKTNKQVVLSQSAFLKHPLPLQRRMLHLILTYLYQTNRSKKRHQSIHIDSLINWLNQGYDSSQWSLPGTYIARKLNNSFVIRLDEQESALNFEPDLKKLPVPGHLSTRIGEFKMEKVDRWSKLQSDECIFLADLDALNLPLALRSFKPGDRIRLFGKNGSKKINRLFIDSKVPKEWRSQWPLVIDGEGQVIWVPALKRSDVALVNEDTTSFLKVTFNPSKDFGRIM